jgi:ribbon-helix-helix CopG family protein
MEEPRTPARRQFSIVLDEEDLAEVERIARDRRGSIAQVIREFVVAGIKRHQSLQAAEVA